MKTLFKAVVPSGLVASGTAMAQTVNMTSGTTMLNRVLAIPAIDHGWTAGNLGGEFYESFEFKIYGCNSGGCELGRITDVYSLGVDNTNAGKNADDWATVWSFNNSYNSFRITSGDRLNGGPFSAGEGEIDALAYAPPIPEPETYAMMLAGLGLLGLARRRKQKEATA